LFHAQGSSSATGLSKLPPQDRGTIYNSTRKHTNIQKETQNLLVSERLWTAVYCIFLCFRKFLFYFIFTVL